MARRPYRILSTGDASVSLAVRCACTCRELLLAAGVSRAAAAAAEAEHRVTCEGVALQAPVALEPGDVVVLALEAADPEFPDVAPADVAWSDPCGILLAVDKPAGLLVHPDGTGAECLADRVQARLAADGRVRCAHAVQRLDVDTTGLVLFSLAPEFQAAMDAQVADGSMEKRYLAVLAGNLARDLVVEQPVGRDRHNARRMHVGSGRPSLTRFSPMGTVPLGGGRTGTLVEASIATGRRHQIRAHASWAGFPVVGDRLYGGPAADALMLHGWRERFSHPLTWERVAVEAPVPASMAGLVAGLL
ncbi:RluA family pseudouridine synthase [Atopobiaceae bacterium 24-176]